VRRGSVPAVLPTAAVLWVVGLSPAFGALTVSRRGNELLATTLDQYPSASAAPLAPWQVLATRISILVAFTTVGAALAHCLARRSRRASRLGAFLLAAGIAMYAAPIISGLVGPHGGAWDWRLWFAPLALLTLYLAPPVPPACLLRHVRGILRVYTWGSLTALLVAPGWALSPSPIVNFRLPGFGSLRLFGLTDHPVLLGVVAMTALVVELAPLDRPRLWPLHAAAAAAVILTAQSRTAWITALVSLPFLYRRDVPHRVPPWITRALGSGLAVNAAFLVPATAAVVGRVMADPEVDSLHGRTEVWDISMHVFESDMVLGYGPRLFLDRASPVHLVYPHAHSQLFQTLATSGLVGAAALALFITALIVAAARSGAASNGLSWALVATPLVTCLTEPPFRGLEISNPYVLVVLLDFAILLAFADSPERPACSSNSSPIPHIRGRSPMAPASAAGTNCAAASRT
jgi:O-antigen ligase